MNPSEIRIGFAPIARPTFDLDLARQLTSQVCDSLQAAGYRLIGAQELIMDSPAVESRISQLAAANCDMLLVLQATFADSTMVLRLARALELPLLLWAMPEAQLGGRLRINSFCGINLAAHGLRRAGIPYDYVYAPPDDRAGHDRLRDFAFAASIKRRLAGARIGRLGERPDGFDTCRVNHAGLRQRFGIEIAQLELTALFERARQADAAKVKALAGDLSGKLAGFDDLDQDATEGSLGVYLALEALAREQCLGGLAARCWPEFFTELGCSACGALSLLSDALLPCSCEADVNGTITQLILQWISGQPAFGSDIVAVDTAADEATLWHCGLAPLSMADPDAQPEATIHSNRAKPLLMQFPLKPGRVTIARLSEAGGEFRLVIGGGEMLKAPAAFTGTSGRIRFDSGAASAMDTIMREGLEHHLSLTYGDHLPVLEAMARMLALPILRL